MICLLLFIFNLGAQDVAIQAEQTSNLRFEKFLVANPTHQSFVQHKQDRPSPESQQLFEDLKKAQFQFIRGSLDLAKQYFKAITQRQHQADWKKDERDAIFYSFFRLAQLEKDQGKQMSWLRSALLFDSQQKPDTTLFPPPLIESYNHLRKRVEVEVWPLPDNAVQFGHILINGRPYKGQTGFIKYRQGQVRITFLSNKYLPVHFITGIEQLSQLKVALIALANGNCENPVFNEATPLSSRFLLVGPECTGLINKPMANNRHLLPDITPQTTPRENRLFKKQVGLGWGFCCRCGAGLA